MKKASNNSRGNYYKNKTRQWFRDQGYTVELLERLQAIWTPRGVIYKKQDIWGADGVSMNGKEIIFWNSKSTVIKNKGVSWLKSTGKSEFEKYPYPSTVKRWVVIWEPKKKPVIVEV